MTDKVLKNTVLFAPNAGTSHWTYLSQRQLAQALEDLEAQEPHPLFPAILEFARDPEMATGAPNFRAILWPPHFSQVGEGVAAWEKGWITSKA